MNVAVDTHLPGLTIPAAAEAVDFG